MAASDEDKRKMCGSVQRGEEKFQNMHNSEQKESKEIVWKEDE